jgi:hypothetical protein
MKNYTVIDNHREHGSSRILIKCPFCDRKFWAYNWSLGGSGKKCKCGSLHNFFGAKKP